MKLGAFSVSLSVKDIHKSKAFYESLGFQVYAGEIERNYLIMKNEETLIGLFQGMFEGNILTFNPGWNQRAETLESFDDVRQIQEHVKSHGITPVKEIEAEAAGPASFVIVDPDGNTILIDQHV